MHIEHWKMTNRLISRNPKSITKKLSPICCFNIDNRFQYYYKNHQTFHRSYTVQPTPAPDTVYKRITVWSLIIHKLYYLSETQINLKSIECFQEKFLNRQRVQDNFIFFKQENAPRIAIIVSIMIYVYPRYWDI